MHVGVGARIVGVVLHVGVGARIVGVGARIVGVVLLSVLYCILVFMSYTPLGCKSHFNQSDANNPHPPPGVSNQ